MRRQYLSNNTNDVIIRIDSLTRITKISVVKNPLFDNYQYTTNKVNRMELSDIQKFYKVEKTEADFSAMAAKCAETILQQFNPDLKIELVKKS